MNKPTLLPFFLGLMISAPALGIDLTPVPEIPGFAHAPPMGEYVDSGPVYVDVAPQPLFTRVKYVDLREKHPCAVTKIIRVNDPCACGTECCPRYVYIEICVPPCGCEHVTCRRAGDRVRYDYGKYAVDVRIKKGYIVVDYQK